MGGPKATQGMLSHGKLMVTPVYLDANPLGVWFPKPWEVLPQEPCPLYS